MHETILFYIKQFSLSQTEIPFRIVLILLLQMRKYTVNIIIINKRMSRQNQSANKQNININLMLKLLLFAIIILILTFQLKNDLQSNIRLTQNQVIGDFGNINHIKIINENEVKNQLREQIAYENRKLASFNHKRFDRPQDRHKQQSKFYSKENNNKKYFKTQNEDNKRFNQNQVSTTLNIQQSETYQNKKLNQQVEVKRLVQKQENQNINLQQKHTLSISNQYNLQKLQKEQFLISEIKNKPSSITLNSKQILTENQNEKKSQQNIPKINLKENKQENTISINEIIEKNNEIRKNIQNQKQLIDNQKSPQIYSNNEKQGIKIKFGYLNTHQNSNQNQDQYKNANNDNIPQLKFPKTPQNQSTPQYLAKIVNITYLQLEVAKNLYLQKYLTQYTKITQFQKQYYQQKYNISSYPQQPFCIVIPTYNNAQQDRYINNLNSVLQQQYSNYRIIVIDDASSDDTGDKLLQFAKQHQISQQKLEIVINKQRKMAMNNIYNAAKSYCKPYEIFIILDGDDELLGRQVFKLFNSQFQAKKYWLAYSNFMTITGYVGYSRPYKKSVIQNNSYRNSSFGISHLRAFYTKLLTLINIQDLKDENGKWFRAANDVAMYIPIAEMVHQKIGYLPQICYYYNSNTGLNNHIVKKNQQRYNQLKIRAKNKYEPIEELFTEEEKLQLKDSLSKKIQIKDYTLPLVQYQGKKFIWEV